jgi:hypothetical protein
LKRTSWFKKVWNGRSKGISTVLGTVFLTLVIFAISTNVFLWTLSRNAEYTLAVKEENQKTADRLNEYVVASGVNYSALEDAITVVGTLSNSGPVAARMINLWVFDTTQQKYANKPVDLSLNPGQTLPYSFTVLISEANGSDIFVGWFMTARGNAIPLESESGVVVAQLAQGIGSMALDFYTFRYFTYDATGKLENYPDGRINFTIPYDTDIAFGVVLTNLDPTKQTITLNMRSLIWVYFPSVPGQAVGPTWYIVNVAPDGTILAEYSEISLIYGEQKLLVFASGQPGSFSRNRISQPQQKNTLSAVNILLYGDIGSKDYGQNIPFVSIFVGE